METSALPKDRIAYIQIIVAATREIILPSFKLAQGPNEANKLKGQISTDGMIEKRNVLSSGEDGSGSITSGDCATLFENIKSVFPVQVTSGYRESAELRSAGQPRTAVST